MPCWSGAASCSARRSVWSLRRLSVFPAWFDMPDATQVGARLGMPASAVSEAVANLVTKSIATAEVTDEGARYRLPETVRAYAREKLAEAGEFDLAFEALAAYVTEQYANASTRQDDARLSWLACIIRNLDNTRACLDWALTDGRDLTAGVELISKALPFWMLGSHLLEHRQYLEPALQHVLKLRPRRMRDELALEIGIALAQYYRQRTDERRYGPVEARARLGAQAFLQAARTCHPVDALWRVGKLGKLPRRDGLRATVRRGLHRRPRASDTAPGVIACLRAPSTITGSSGTP